MKMSEFTDNQGDTYTHNSNGPIVPHTNVPPTGTAAFGRRSRTNSSSLDSSTPAIVIDFTQMNNAPPAHHRRASTRRSQQIEERDNIVANSSSFTAAAATTVVPSGFISDFSTATAAARSTAMTDVTPPQTASHLLRVSSLNQFRSVASDVLELGNKLSSKVSTPTPSHSNPHPPNINHSLHTRNSDSIHVSSSLLASSSPFSAHSTATHALISSNSLQSVQSTVSATAAPSAAHARDRKSAPTNRSTPTAAAALSDVGHPTFLHSALSSTAISMVARAKAARSTDTNSGPLFLRKSSTATNGNGGYSSSVGDIRTPPKIVPSSTSIVHSIPTSPEWPAPAPAARIGSAPLIASPRLQQQLFAPPASALAHSHATALKDPPTFNEAVRGLKAKKLRKEQAKSQQQQQQSHVSTASSSVASPTRGLRVLASPPISSNSTHHRSTYQPLNSNASPVSPTSPTATSSTSVAVLPHRVYSEKQYARIGRDVPLAAGIGNSNFFKSEVTDTMLLQGNQQTSKVEMMQPALSLAAASASSSASTLPNPILISSSSPPPPMIRSGAISSSATTTTTAAQRLQEHRARARRDALRVEELNLQLKRDKELIAEKENEATYRRRAEVYALNHIKRLYHEEMFEQLMQMQRDKQRQQANGNQSRLQQPNTARRSFDSEVASI